MENNAYGLLAIALIIAFFPFFVSLKGRGGAWQFLSLMFCLFSLFGIGFPIGGLVAWVVAWIFAAVSIGARKSDERFERLERKINEAKTSNSRAEPKF